LILGFERSETCSKLLLNLTFKICPWLERTVNLMGSCFEDCELPSSLTLTYSIAGDGGFGTATVNHNMQKYSKDAGITVQSTENDKYSNE